MNETRTEKMALLEQALDGCLDGIERTLRKAHFEVRGEAAFFALLNTNLEMQAESPATAAGVSAAAMMRLLALRRTGKVGVSA